MLKQLPTIERLRDALLSNLADQGLGIGDRIPSEGKLAEKYGVSRNTVREAMIQLESEGVVARCHGVGTILRCTPATYVRTTSLPELIESTGKKPGVERITVTKDILYPEIAKRFRLPSDTKLVRLERALTADGRRVAFIVDYLLQGRLEEWVVDWSEFDGNLIRVLSRNTGSERFLQNASVSAMLADDQVAEDLQCDPGAALTVVSTDMFSERVELLAVSRLLFIPGIVPIRFAGTIHATKTP